MNADNPKLDDNDPVHHLAAELAWYAQDLQNRLRNHQVNHVIALDLVEIQILAKRIEDFCNSVKAANVPSSAAPPDAETIAPTTPTTAPAIAGSSTTAPARSPGSSGKHQKGGAP